MQRIFIAGTTGRDAEHKTTQGGTDLCSFSVAVNTGFGDNKLTTWFDVTKWGKGAEGLSRILRKGSKVAVAGELGTREHNGRTYLQVRADDVTIQGTPGARDDAPSGTQAAYGGDSNQSRVDLDDEVPF